MARLSFTWLATTVLLLPLALQGDAAGTSSYNGLALTPAMGWDNWNAFGCKISEELILSTAQKIVDFGLRDLGRKPAARSMQLSKERDTDVCLQATTTSF